MNLTNKKVTKVASIYGSTKMTILCREVLSLLTIKNCTKNLSRQNQFVPMDNKSKDVKQQYRVLQRINRLVTPLFLSQKRKRKLLQLKPHLIVRHKKADFRRLIC